ncbi:MAG TPA: hypothetical protein VNM92_00925 [Thermoanaerobaculia bacterium]|nr:hypothetical protein [Thermoanaerobaculia bacterium]
MLSERTIELIQLHADGTGSPEERTELEKIVASSDEARLELESVTALLTKLNAESPLEAPPGFRQDVLARVRAEQSTSPRHPSKRSRTRHVGLAWAAAALLVTGVAFVGSRDSGGNRELRDRAVGAVVSDQKQTESDSSDWLLVTPLESSAPRGSGTALTIRRKGDRLAVDVSFDQTPASGLAIEWDSRELTLADDATSFDQRNGAAAAIEKASFAAEGRGTKSFLFNVRRTPTTRTIITVSRSGSSILSTSIPIQ